MNESVETIVNKLGLKNEDVNCIQTNGLNIGLGIKLYKYLLSNEISRVEFFYLASVDADVVNLEALTSKLWRNLEKCKPKRGAYLEKILLQTLEIPLKDTGKKPKPKAQRKENDTIIISNPSVSKRSILENSEVKKLKTSLTKCMNNLKNRRETVNLLREEVKQRKRALDRLKNKHESIKNFKIEKEKLKSKYLKKNPKEESYWQQIQKYRNVIRDKNIKIRNESSKVLKGIKKVNKLESNILLQKQTIDAKDLELDIQQEQNHQLVIDSKDLKKENDYLVSLLQEHSQINLYDHDKRGFSSETVHCVMDMVSAGVPSSSVGVVLDKVGHLCGHTFDKLPSRRTVDNISQRRLAVAHHQISELQHSSNQTLHTDETQKYGKQYMVYINTTNEKKHMVLGLKPISTKSAEDTLATLQTTLKDIGDTCNLPKLADKVIVNIKNTMSDRASTEKLFNRILEDYRSQLLPQIVQNYNNLSEEQIKSLKCMNNFFCGLHLMISFAESTDKTLKSMEKELGPLGAASDSATKPFVRASESAIIRLLRTSCKLFAKSVKLNNDNNCFQHFTSYLESKNEKNVLVEFINNRFNILFYNAEAVFYLSRHIVDFLENVHGLPTTLYKAVLLDHKVDWYMAGCKALAILSKTITSPLWRLLEDDTISISQLDSVYTEIVLFLKACSNDDAHVQLLREGLNRPFCLTNLVNEDYVYDYIMQNYAYDHLVDNILKQLCKDWSSLLERLVKDHLPDGKFHTMSQKDVEETQSVVKHNKVAEELFGKLDRLIKLKPNATILTHESHIVFNKNRTSTWLYEQPDDTRKKILASCSKETKVLKCKSKDLLENIKAEKCLTLDEKKKKIEQKRTKEFNDKQNITKEMIHYGLWQKCEDIDRKLSEISSKGEQLKALKSQILFRKVVLNQPVTDKKLYQFSSKETGTYSVDVLKQHLKELLDSALNDNTITEDFLVGHRVRHKFETENGYAWFVGRVISTVPGFSSWYNIVYEDEEEESVYSFKLMDDHISGDLVVLFEEGLEVISVVKTSLKFNLILFLTNYVLLYYLICNILIFSILICIII